MRLEAKLALFNALSKLLLVLLGALVIPPIVQRVAVAHTDFSACATKSRSCCPHRPRRPGRPSSAASGPKPTPTINIA